MGKHPLPSRPRARSRAKDARQTDTGNYYNEAAWQLLIYITAGWIRGDSQTECLVTQGTLLRVQAGTHPFDTDIWVATASNTGDAFIVYFISRRWYCVFHSRFLYLCFRSDVFLCHLYGRYVYTLEQCRHGVIIGPNRHNKIPPLWYAVSTKCKGVDKSCVFQVCRVTVRPVSRSHTHLHCLWGSFARSNSIRLKTPVFLAMFPSPWPTLVPCQTSHCLKKLSLWLSVQFNKYGFLLQICWILTSCYEQFYITNWGHCPSSLIWSSLFVFPILTDLPNSFTASYTIRVCFVNV